MSDEQPCSVHCCYNPSDPVLTGSVCDCNGRTVGKLEVHYVGVVTGTPRRSHIFPLHVAVDERDRHIRSYRALWWAEEAERIVRNLWDHPVARAYMWPYGEDDLRFP